MFLHPFHSPEYPQYPVRLPEHLQETTPSSLEGWHGATLRLSAKQGSIFGFTLDKTDLQGKLQEDGTFDQLRKNLGFSDIYRIITVY